MIVLSATQTYMSEMKRKFAQYRWHGGRKRVEPKLKIPSTTNSRWSGLSLFVFPFRPNSLYLTAVFFKLVQCQPRLNHKIQPIVVEGVHFNHT